MLLGDTIIGKDTELYKRLAKIKKERYPFYPDIPVHVLSESDFQHGNTAGVLSMIVAATTKSRTPYIFFREKMFAGCSDDTLSEILRHELDHVLKALPGYRITEIATRGVEKLFVQNSGCTEIESELVSVTSSCLIDVIDDYHSHDQYKTSDYIRDISRLFEKYAGGYQNKPINKFTPQDIYDVTGLLVVYFWRFYQKQSNKVLNPMYNQIASEVLKSPPAKQYFTTIISLTKELKNYPRGYLKVYKKMLQATIDFIRALDLSKNYNNSAGRSLKDFVTEKQEQEEPSVLHPEPSEQEIENAAQILNEISKEDEDEEEIKEVIASAVEDVLKEIEDQKQGIGRSARGYSKGGLPFKDTELSSTNTKKQVLEKLLSPEYEGIKPVGQLDESEYESLTMALKMRNMSDGILHNLNVKDINVEKTVRSPLFLANGLLLPGKNIFKKKQITINGTGNRIHRAYLSDMAFVIDTSGSIKENEVIDSLVVLAKTFKEYSPKNLMVSLFADNTYYQKMFSSGVTYLDVIKVAENICSGGTSVLSGLMSVYDVMRSGDLSRGSTVVLMSDLIDDHQQIMSGLRMLNSLGCSIFVVSNSEPLKDTNHYAKEIVVAESYKEGVRKLSDIIRKHYNRELISDFGNERSPYSDRNTGVSWGL